MRKNMPFAEPGPRFIKQKRYELVLIAHLHMRIVKIQRVVQSARILPIHVKEGDIITYEENQRASIFS